MKRFLIVLLMIACVILGALGVTVAREYLEPSTHLTAETVKEELITCNELASEKLDYHGLVKYENGSIAFINKKAFTMTYHAQVLAGVDLSKATVLVEGRTITVILPAPEVLGVEIDADSLEFYDEKYALFNWQDRQDTAEALRLAQEDALARANQTELLNEAGKNAKALVEALLNPLTLIEEPYRVEVSLTQM